MCTAVKASETDPLTLEARAADPALADRSVSSHRRCGFVLAVVAGKAVGGRTRPDRHPVSRRHSPVWRSSVTFACRLGVRCCWSPPLPRAACVTSSGFPRSSTSSTTRWYFSSHLRPRIGRRERPADAPGRWLGVFFLVVLLSAVAHPDVPTRAVLFVLIAGEPLVVIWAIARWGVDDRCGAYGRDRGDRCLPRSRSRSASTRAWSMDGRTRFRARLVGHGAGHHVLGALFALALFVVIAAVLARRVNPSRRSGAAPPSASA